MKLRIFFSTLFMVGLFGALQAQTTLNMDVKTLDGKTINLQDAYGGKNDKLTVISFWATWCKPCQNELDAISYLYEDWQDDFDVELVALTVDSRRQLAKVGPLVATKG